jgi:ABC-2 type transport system ATP-binding protein
LSLAIETKQLTKTYKSRGGKGVDVVKDLDLQVERGEIFGFLGPNGAGKTTTIKILLGIIHATSGEAFVLEKVAGDIQAHKKLSYLPERPYYYEHMTGLEVMHFYASLFKINDDALCKRLLERVNLANDMNRPISEYSKGMQQRVGLAQSLLNDPELLFLDEPTGGLDPLAHKEVRDLILQFRDEGRTVFISSHELSEIELICDRVAIINKGIVIKQGHLNELLTGARIELTFKGLAADKAKEIAGSEAVVSQSGNSTVIDMAAGNNTDAIIDKVRAGGGSVVSVIPRRMRLEDLFVESVREHTDRKHEGGAA